MNIFEKHPIPWRFEQTEMRKNYDVGHGEEIYRANYPRIVDKNGVTIISDSRIDLLEMIVLCVNICNGKPEIAEKLLHSLHNLSADDVRDYDNSECRIILQQLYDRYRELEAK